MTDTEREQGKDFAEMLAAYAKAAGLDPKLCASYAEFGRMCYAAGRRAELERAVSALRKLAWTEEDIEHFKEWGR